MSRDWTREETLLLRAALVPGPAGDEAYRAWRETADVQTLDHAEFRVLPLLGRHLDGDPDDPLAAQIRNILRFAWLRSQLLIQRAGGRVGVLEEAGIPVMLSKGAAVLQHTGWEVQLRPMDDLDVIVPRERAEEAARALLAADMHQASLPPDPAQTVIYDQVHALDFRDTAGAVLDLHWHVLHGSLHRGADAEFWERSQPATLGATPVRVLSREDTLLQVVAHGAELNAQHLLRWAADAALLLRDGPPVDWDLVGRTAHRHRIAGPVAAALGPARRRRPEPRAGDAAPGAAGAPAPRDPARARRGPEPHRVRPAGRAARERPPPGAPARLRDRGRRRRARPRAAGAGAVGPQRRAAAARRACRRRGRPGGRAGRARVPRGRRGHGPPRARMVGAGRARHVVTRAAARSSAPGSTSPPGRRCASTSRSSRCSRRGGRR